MGRAVEVCRDCRLDVCPETCFWPHQGLCADCVDRGGAGSGSDTLLGRRQLASFGPTHLEEGLRRAQAGPDTTWMEDPHAGEKEARGELRQLS